MTNDFLEHLHFNDIAKHIDALKTSLFDGSQPNNFKLQFIKEELQSGRYEINAQHIAHRLLDQATSHIETELELIG